MASFRISGVWKNTDNVITHYAFHTINESTTSRAKKTAKQEAIILLEKLGNSATTWVWNYNTSGWIVGEKVEVVKGGDGKYLRSNPDNVKTNNLAHLIDYDWIAQ